MKEFAHCLATCCAALIAATAVAHADNPTAITEEDGKWLTEEGLPTFKIDEDGSEPVNE